MKAQKKVQNLRLTLTVGKDCQTSEAKRNKKLIWKPRMKFIPGREIIIPGFGVN